MSKEETRKSVGQMMMVGVASSSLSAEEADFLRSYNVGGVILFRRNWENLEKLFDLVREIKGLNDDFPIMIGVDQEGGDVIRFGPPFTQFPGNDFLGRCFEKTASTRLIREYAHILSGELKTSGIDICFAPVVDILTNPQNKVIGKRAFSEREGIVSKLGSVIIDEFEKVGSISCAKHFPGHGDTLEDSHAELPRVGHDLEFLMKRELKPFIAAISAGVPMVMAGHILYEQIDGAYPASLSFKILDGVLRERLGFENIIISDDLEMKAIETNYDIAEAAVLSIRAGADIVMVCHTLAKAEKIYGSLQKGASEDGEMKRRINESAVRIRRLKRAYDVEARIPDLKKVFETFEDQRSIEFAEKMRRF